MADTSLVFNLVARDRASATVSRMGERFNTAAAGIGAGFAAVLGMSVVQGLDMEAANAKLTAQLGLGPAEAAAAGDAAASVYAGAWGESIDEVNLAVKGVYQNIGDTSAAEGGLEGVTSKVLALAETYDQDLTMATAAAGQMVRTGLAADTDEALDIIATGLGTAADKSGDLLESLNEYSTQWRRVGLDGETSIGLINQALQNGARDADQVSDAIGQFGERALANGAPVQEAYKSIGLSSDEMAKKIGEGGSSAEQALQMTLDALRGTKDETVKLNAAAALFGDPANVMGDALYAMDPASAAAAAGMDKADGAMGRLTETMSGTAKKQLESFKRTVLTELGTATGRLITFASENSGTMKPLLIGFVALAAAVVAARVAMFVYSTVSAVVGAAHTVISASMWTVIGGWLRMAAVGLLTYARIAAGAVVSAAITGAAWVGSALVSIGTWIAAVVRAGAVAAGQFLIMAARAVAWAVVMAAQWLIAMGPIGWIIAAVIGLALLIYANWDTIKRWTAEAWDWVWSKIKGIGQTLLDFFMTWTIIGQVIRHWDTIKAKTSEIWNGLMDWIKGVPGRIVGFFQGWNIAQTVRDHWQRVKDGAIRKAAELVIWVRGLPGRIRDGLGNLGDLLLQKGKNVVEGLWSGIQSMGGWIAGKITGWARSMIPGPIAKALGIASPSKVTKEQGRWIGRGLVDGLTGTAKQVKAAASKLADIVRDSLKPGAARNRALAKIASGNKQLAALANREAALAARMKTASKALADQIKARDKLAADVRKGILDSANITQNDGGPTSADAILDQLLRKAADARQFAAQLAVLKKKGVRSDLISQIANAGVEQGLGTATALANANSSQIKQINSTQASLVKAAGQAGATAGDAMYGAGIQAAQGIVKGLASQQKAIEKQMEKIAKSMASSIKKALGIKSPSRLMADEVGRFVPLGVAEGVAEAQGVLDRAMAAMVQPPSLPAAPGTGRPVAPAPLPDGIGGGRTVLEIRSSGGRTADFLVELLREAVRAKGGDVQMVIGQRQR
ncbi:phage tail tape measure protein [Streptomyces sp. NPDC093109]|uniref:phage tail tape measure protein n=1 Tax=Streptomyces sp. NPDC093109 TaxID=3154977 RepID=UPI00344F9A90